MLIIFEFVFYCFVYHQNVTCLKHFIRYEHYTDESEDNDGQTRRCLSNRCAKN